MLSKEELVALCIPFQAVLFLYFLVVNVEHIWISVSLLATNLAAGIFFSGQG
ncbi:MAG: hypothetical protein RI911_427 [Candidatus Parcubacteria bacterium]|jgi:hypothetical protein